VFIFLSETKEWKSFMSFAAKRKLREKRGKLMIIGMVIVNFPIEIIEIAASDDENVNEESLDLTKTLIKGEMSKELNKINTKELQRLCFTPKHNSKPVFPSYKLREWISVSTPSQKHEEIRLKFIMSVRHTN
jgi:hypothetical protein